MYSIQILRQESRLASRLKFDSRLNCPPNSERTCVISNPNPHENHGADMMVDMQERRLLLLLSQNEEHRLDEFKNAQTQEHPRSDDNFEPLGVRQEVELLAPKNVSVVESDHPHADDKGRTGNQLEHVVVSDRVLQTVRFLRLHVLGTSQEDVPEVQENQRHDDHRRDDQEVRVRGRDCKYSNISLLKDSKANENFILSTINKHVSVKILKVQTLHKSFSTNSVSIFRPSMFFDPKYFYQILSSEITAHRSTLQVELKKFSIGLLSVE